MRDKQIEEMYKDVYEAINHNSVIDVTHGGYIGISTEGLTRELYDEGYRKASDVVREIAEEILDMANVHGAGVMFWHKMQKFADALKKKYIGTDTNVLTKESEGEG